LSILIDSCILLRNSINVASALLGIVDITF
jgi:hypothetical protein